MPEAGQVDAARVTVYRDKAGEWRWSAADTNGEKVADSAEGYDDMTYTIKAAEHLFPDAEVFVFSGDADSFPVVEDDEEA